MLAWIMETDFLHRHRALSLLVVCLHSLNPWWLKMDCLHSLFPVFLVFLSNSKCLSKYLNDLVFVSWNMNTNKYNFFFYTYIHTHILSFWELALLYFFLLEVLVAVRPVKSKIIALFSKTLVIGFFKQRNISILFFCCVLISGFLTPHSCRCGNNFGL